MVYYNPDANSGGQFVCNTFAHENLLEAFEKNPVESTFWINLEDYADQYLIDINTHEFKDVAHQFINLQSDFRGETQTNMNALYDWATTQQANLAPSQNIDMGCS